MKIGITGASGLIGTPLVAELRRQGHEVVRFTRGRAEAADERGWDPASRRLEPEAVADLDAVVHLAGAAAAASGQGPRVLLSASAIGVYGDTGDRVTDETGPVGAGFLADVCRQWEAATAPAEQAGVRVAHLRTGIVLAKTGGALAKQLPIFKLGAGAPLGTGRQWTSWISLRDEIGAIVHCLTADASGPVNLVGPAPVTNRDFTKALGRAVHRPTLPIAIPGFVLTAALGQFAEEGVLTGQRLVPAVLQRTGYRFQDPDVDAALRSAL